MRTFITTLRRAGLQGDGSIVTVESLEVIAQETAVPFSIRAGDQVIGRITRLWVEADELRGEANFDADGAQPPAAC